MKTEILLDEIKELIAVKDRLAKNKISVPINVLMEGLLSPEVLPYEKIDKLPDLLTLRECSMDGL